MSSLSAVCPSTEDRFLLLCARTVLEPAQEQAIRQLAGQALDWHKVASRAIRHGLPTLVYHHLRQLGLEGEVPGDAWRVLEEANRLGVVLTMLQQLESGRLLDALRAAGSEAMPLKGLFLRERIFPDPALRLCSDLDFLVQPGAVKQVEEILRDLGYLPDETYSPREWYQPERVHHLIPYYLPGRKVQVEVHWDLMPPEDGFPIDVEGLWQRARAGQVVGRPVKVLAPEDLLLHLSLHVAAHHRFQTGLRHLVDPAEVIRFWGAQLDWQQVIARATSWKAGRYLYLTVRLAHELLDAPVPEAALDQMRPEMFAEQMVAFARQRLLTAVRPGDPAPASENLASFLLGGQGTGRLRTFWTSLFPSRERMAFLYNLSPDSPQLYFHYLLRPFQLLGRYLPVLIGAILGHEQSSEAIEFKKQELLLERWLAPGGKSPSAG